MGGLHGDVTSQLLYESKLRFLRIYKRDEMLVEPFSGS